MKGPPQREIWTVSRLVSEVIARLERDFPAVWVQGEISGFTKHASGHWYFTLKDEAAQLRAVMFKGQNLYMRFLPEDGMKVLCRGRMSGFIQRGLIQLHVEYMEPLGMGELYLEFERLKRKLEREGLFDPKRKKPLPPSIKRVAIITSLEAAALQDMLRILRERDPGIEVLIIPAAVQGAAAARELASAVEKANKPSVARPARRPPLDAIIIGRGGGSIEDLWAFNEEVLARAVAASTVPVISAVGHEVDFTICDFAADLRAPTPTAAAEMVCAGRKEVEHRLSLLGSSLAREMSARLEQAYEELHGLGSRLRSPQRKLLETEMRLDELSERASRAMKTRIKNQEDTLRLLADSLRARDPRRLLKIQKEKLITLKERLAISGKNNLSLKRQQLQAAMAALNALSPLNTLERGFAVVLNQEGRAVKDAKFVSLEDRLDVLLHRGRLGVVVKSKSEKRE